PRPAYEGSRFTRRGGALALLSPQTPPFEQRGGRAPGSAATAPSSAPLPSWSDPSGAPRRTRRPHRPFRRGWIWCRLGTAERRGRGWSPLVTAALVASRDSSAHAERTGQ